MYVTELITTIVSPVTIFTSPPQNSRHRRIQAFERSLVEAAENFSHNLAALRSYEVGEEADERDGGLKRSLSEHYLPAVAVPDFAEVAFDAIRRAQRMRQVKMGNPNLFSRYVHCCPNPPH